MWARPRGDRLMTSPAHSQALPAPPHRRGSTVHRLHAPPSGPVCPAQAGVYPLPTPTPSGSQGLPRTGGGLPDDLAAAAVLAVVAPHTRG